MSDDRRILQAFMRNNLYFFVQKVFTTLNPGVEYIDNWHVEAICFHLEKIIDGEIDRLLITIPPRHLKSICTSVALAAWVLGRDPTQKMIVASYGADLANKHSRDFQRIIESNWYKALFPDMRHKPLKNTTTEFITKQNGLRKAVSLGGAVTGFGADILIIDDLMKAQEARSETERANAKAYYEESLLSRFNNKKRGKVIVIQQRLHEDDFAGYLLEKGTFTHLNLPAIAQEPQGIDLYRNRQKHRAPGDLLFPQQEPADTLEKLRLDMGGYAFSAQYLQNPTPIDGARVKWDKVPTYEGSLDPKSFQIIAQSWDTGLTAEATSDFSVCVTWGFRDGKWYLLDIYRDRLDYGPLKARVETMRAKWNAYRVVMENAATGQLLIRDFRNEGRKPLESYQPVGDKETRFEAQIAKLESGNYILPAQAPFMDAFKKELSAFPNSKYDDQVDATSQFLDWSMNRRGRSATNRDPETGRRRSSRRR